ncbi:arsenate reductase family protein [uncultured Coprobacter sp.]|jgi:transcriptional regulator, spx/mgsR family|uniref:arsenate reductase family protein n=1 Tax=uncultured Coprobacter sp. TaxID=1720550 RepID=UPI0025E799D7|nr:arsenate reductase family protein [uncultured Coprobacter sp.]
MKPLFIQYPKCGTCRKAAQWLKSNNIDVITRDIVSDNPTQQELSIWIEKSGKPIQKFFNTSGLRYKELNLKEKIKNTQQEELLRILASEGMLIKRPVLISGNTVLTGFNEEEWSKALLKPEKA